MLAQLLAAPLQCLCSAMLLLLQLPVDIQENEGTHQLHKEPTLLLSAFSISDSRFSKHYKYYISTTSPESSKSGSHPRSHGAALFSKSVMQKHNLFHSEGENWLGNISTNFCQLDYLEWNI